MSHVVGQSRYHYPLPLSLPLTPASTARCSSAASPSLYTGSRRSPEVTSSTAEEPNDGVENEDGGAFDDFEEKAFLVMGKTTRPRSWCIAAVMWPYPFPHCNYLQPVAALLSILHCSIFLFGSEKIPELKPTGL